MQNDLLHVWSRNVSGGGLGWGGSCLLYFFFSFKSTRALEFGWACLMRLSYVWKSSCLWGGGSASKEEVAGRGEGASKARAPSFMSFSCEVMRMYRGADANVRRAWGHFTSLMESMCGWKKKVWSREKLPKNSSQHIAVYFKILLCLFPCVFIKT